jgi:A/G-specific adenine glycosylase
MQEIRQSLLGYWRREARDLPWRRTRDPYRIWVSEIMLQQTQVTTASGRYVRFLKRFPDVHTLANAGVDAVCEEWAGLGYYSRAKNLHAAACCIVEDYGGRLPRQFEALQSLPGIGRYTAGAIASIAHGLAVPAVDANAERVLSRLFAVDGPPSSARTNHLWQLAAELAASGDAGCINQALMDVAAAFCRGSNPRCSACPLADHCVARREGHPETYPVKKKKAVRAVLPVAMLWLSRDDGSLLIEQRAPTGLWAGQWQLPSEEGEGALERLLARIGCDARPGGVQVRHRLTHRDVIADLYRGTENFDRPVERSRWTSSAREAPVNALSRKMIRLILP